MRSQFSAPFSPSLPAIFRVVIVVCFGSISQNKKKKKEEIPARFILEILRVAITDDTSGISSSSLNKSSIIFKMFTASVQRGVFFLNLFTGVWLPVDEAKEKTSRDLPVNALRQKQTIFYNVYLVYFCYRC